MSGLWTLLVAQFVLVYLSVLQMGILVYGLNSDFDAPPPFLYYSLWLIVPAHFGLKLWQRRGHGARPSIERWGFRLALAACAVLGSSLARDLHFGFFDEFDLGQAMKLTALGWASYFVARGAAARLESGSRLPGALALLALVWLPAALYPFSPLGGLAVIAVLGLLATVATPGSAATSADAGASDRRRPGFGGYLMLLVAFDLFAIVMDYQLDTHWASLWALALLAAAVAGLWARTGRSLVAPHALGVANFLLALWWPGWVNTPVHAALTGLWLGAILSSFASPRRLVGVGAAWALGGLLAYAFYGRLVLLPHATWLLAPIVLGYLFRGARSRSEPTADRSPSSA